jgi:hypothetical protein
MSKPTPAENDLAWGAEEIGAEIQRSASQVYYLHETGRLKGAVTKLGPRTLIGSRSKLKALLANLIDSGGDSSAA